MRNNNIPIYSKNDFEKALDLGNTLALSKKFLKTKQVIELLRTNKKSQKLQKDILSINSVSSKLLDNINNNKSTNLALISLNKTGINISASYALAYFFSNSNKMVTLINYSSKHRQQTKYL